MPTMSPNQVCCDSKAQLARSGTGTHSVQCGMVLTESPMSVDQTVRSLTAAIEDKGFTHFSTIDHSANAKKAGLSLPPTQLIIFGNPKIGTLAMQKAPTIAIELPQKFLVWQDAEKRTWIGYPDPAQVFEQHQLDDSELREKISKALAGLVDTATTP